MSDAPNGVKQLVVSRGFQQMGNSLIVLVVKQCSPYIVGLSNQVTSNFRYATIVLAVALSYLQVGGKTPTVL